MVFSSFSSFKIVLPQTKIQSFAILHAERGKILGYTARIKVPNNNLAIHASS
jgi:hypothetical protein